MENILVKEYQLPKEIVDELGENKVDLSMIEVCNFIEANKQHHLWYGGDIVKIKYKDIDIFIAALGNINITLLGKDTERELFHVKDKFNSGNAYQSLSRYIENDKELKQIIKNEHLKYKLHVFSDCNWWEAYVGYNGERHDIMWDLDADTLTEAIIKTFKELDEIYGFFEENYM